MGKKDSKNKTKSLNGCMFVQKNANMLGKDRVNKLISINPSDGVVASNQEEIPVHSKNKYASSSRFSSYEESAQTMTCIDVNETDTGGIVLWSDGHKMLVDRDDNHTIVFGSTGSRKTTTIVLPSLMSIANEGHSMILSDPKGELQAEIRGYLIEKGYNIKVLDLNNPTTSDGWNPLVMPYHLYHSKDPVLKDRGETLVTDYSMSICPIEDKSDPYWERSAQSLIAGAILLLFELCKDEREINLVSVQAILNKICAETDQGEIRDYLNTLDASSPVQNRLSTTVFNASNTKLCIMSTARSKLADFTSLTTINELLSTNDIDIEDMWKRKTAVFISVPDERTTFNSIVTAFVKQAYTVMISHAKSRPDMRLPIPVDIVLDEFANIPPLPDMESMITASRSRGIRFLLVLQGLNQLCSKYGEEVAKCIVGNCTNIIYIYSREMDLLKHISELAGEDSDGKPLITIDALQRFDKDKGEYLLLHGRNYPFISHVVSVREYNLPHPDIISAPSIKPKVHVMNVSSALRNRNRIPDKTLKEILVGADSDY